MLPPRLGDYEKLAADYPTEAFYWQEMAHISRLLAYLLKDAGRIQEAETACRQGVAIHEKLVAEFPAVAEYRSRLSANLGELAENLLQQAKWDYAIAVHTDAIQLQPGKSTTYNALAWLLATCPDQQVWKPARAVELATKAVELAPKDGAYWNTLGAAHYRAGDYRAAIEALGKAMEFRSGGDAFEWFFLAMAHWQLKNSDEARQWYDKAVPWMEKNKPDDKELQRFRAEAAELLGISVPPPEEKEKAEAKPKAESGQGN